MEDNFTYIVIGFALLAPVFWWFVKKGEREEAAEAAKEADFRQSLANMPFEKQSVPLSEEEYKYFRNQYTILMILPVFFVGLFCVTWYFNPPANARDWVYATAMGAGILAASYFILKHRSRSNVTKIVVRGVVCEKNRIRKGKYTSYTLKVGDSSMPVSRGDFRKYQLGDVVSMEKIDDVMFSRGRLTLIGKAQQ